MFSKLHDVTSFRKLVKFAVQEGYWQSVEWDISLIRDLLVTTRK